jgi:hypothetical protein
MSFYAYLKQPGGCDYTIGCGNLLIGLNSENLKDAAIQLKQEIENNYTGDRRLESVELIEGKSIHIDVQSIYDEIEEESTKNKQQEIEKQEKAEFERLKRKFEK